MKNQEQNKIILREKEDKVEDIDTAYILLKLTKVSVDTLIEWGILRERTQELNQEQINSLLLFPRFHLENDLAQTGINKRTSTHNVKALRIALQMYLNKQFSILQIGRSVRVFSIYEEADGLDISNLNLLNICLEKSKIILSPKRLDQYLHDIQPLDVPNRLPLYSYLEIIQMGVDRPDFQENSKIFWGTTLIKSLPQAISYLDFEYNKELAQMKKKKVIPNIKSILLKPVIVSKDSNIPDPISELEQRIFKVENESAQQEQIKQSSSKINNSVSSENEDNRNTMSPKLEGQLKELRTGIAVEFESQRQEDQISEEQDIEQIQEVQQEQEKININQDREDNQTANEQDNNQNANQLLINDKLHQQQQQQKKYRSPGLQESRMRRIIEENSEKQIKFSNETLNRLYPLPRIPKKYVKSPEHSRVFYVYADPNVTYALPRSVEEIDREQKACYQPNPLFLHDFKFPIDIPFLPQEFEMKSILRQPDDFQRIISERKMKEQLLQREFELQLKYAKEKKQAKRLAEKQNPRNNNDNKNMNQDQQLEKENNNNLLNKSGEISEEDFEEDEEDEEEALIRNAFNYATDQEGRIHSLPRVFENISSDQATSSSANPVPIHQIKREFYKVKSPPHSNKFKKLHWNQLKESKFIYTDELDMLLREEGNEPDKEWRENKKRTRIERLSIPIHDRSIIPKKLNEINAKINQKTQSRNIKLSGNKEDESFNPLAVSADEVLKKFKPQKQQIEVYQQLGKALKLKQLDPKAVAERSNTEYIFYKENKENKGEKQLDLSQYSKVPYESLSMGWKPSPNQLQISIKLFEDKMNENKGQQIKIKQMEKKRKEGRIQEIVQKDGSINGIESDDEFNYGSQSTKVNVAPTLLFMIPHAFIQEDEDETNGQQQQQQFTNGKQSEYTEVDSPSERAKIRKQQEKQQEKMKNNKLNYSQLSDEQKSTIVQQTYYLQKQLTMEHAKEEDIKCKQRMDEVLKEKSRKEKNKIKQQHISQEQCLTSGDENEEEFEVELNQTTNLGITTKKELYEKKNKERQERLKKKKEFAESLRIKNKQKNKNLNYAEQQNKYRQQQSKQDEQQQYYQQTDIEQQQTYNQQEQQQQQKEKELCQILPIIEQEIPVNIENENENERIEIVQSQVSNQNTYQEEKDKQENETDKQQSQELQDINIEIENEENEQQLSETGRFNSFYYNQMMHRVKNQKLLSLKSKKEIMFFINEDESNTERIYPPNIIDQMGQLDEERLKRMSWATEPGASSSLPHLYSSQMTSRHINNQDKLNQENYFQEQKRINSNSGSPIERKQSAINSSQLQVNQSIPVSQRSDAGEFLSLRNGVQRGKEKEIKQWNSYEDNVEINSENKKSRNILDSLDQDNGILGNGNNKFKIMHLRGIYQTESIEDNTERQSAQKLKETSKINEKDLKNKRLPSLHTPGQHQSQNHQNRTESQLQKSLSSTRTLSIRGSAQLPSGHSGYRAAVNKT